MEVHSGRLITSLLTLGVILASLMGYLNVSKIPFVKFGRIPFSVPLSVWILLVILIVLFLFDNCILGGPWTPIFPLIVVTLMFSNWIIGLAAALINAILLFTIGRIGGD